MHDMDVIQKLTQLDVNHKIAALICSVFGTCGLTFLSASCRHFWPKPGRDLAASTFQEASEPVDIVPVELDADS